ncbi:MAG: hypothetical protein RJA49_2234 [Actinomycetota bacterium]
MGLDHLALLRADLARFADAVEHGPPDAPVAGCPGWTLFDLGVHLGDVHRWVLGALATGGPPTGAHDDPAPTVGSAALAAWVRAGSTRLLTALDAVDPDAPTWHPFPVEPKLAGLWRRRQAHEASVHRWDAERAAGGSPTIDAAFAADGVDEYWTVMLPRMLQREQRRTPASTVAVTLADTGQRWAVDGGSGLPVLLPAGAPADAEFTADAASALLRWWGRPVHVEPVIAGDPSVMDAWLQLGGA